MKKIDILDIGDFVRYNGCRKLTSIMYTSMYKYLTKGKYYKILDKASVSNKLYYQILNDCDGALWYPVECFKVTDRELMIKKYNLK